MNNFQEYMQSLKTKRIWWKPWTWRRRSIWHAYCPMQETSDSVAYAVNPMLGQPEGREIEIPNVFEPTKPTTWEQEDTTL